MSVTRWHGDRPEPDHEGGFVRYDDYKAVVDRLEHALTEIDDHDAEIEAAAKAQGETEKAWRADRERLKAAESRLDKARAAFRAADNGSNNDWCDATKEAWPVNSDKWLALEDALFAGIVEMQWFKCAVPSCGTLIDRGTHCPDHR